MKSLEACLWSRSQRQHLKRVTNSEYLTESEIIALRAAMANDKDFANEVLRLLEARSEEVKITEAQSIKGLLWLKDVWHSPSGKERKRHSLRH